MNLNDLRFDALRDQGFTGQVNDMLLAWAQVNGGTSGALNDALYEMLGIQGGVGTLNDRWFQVLGLLGYQGALNDRMVQFWSDGGSFTLTALTGWTGLPNCVIPPRGLFAYQGSRVGVTGHYATYQMHQDMPLPVNQAIFEAEIYISNNDDELRSIVAWATDVEGANLVSAAMFLQASGHAESNKLTFRFRNDAAGNSDFHFDTDLPIGRWLNCRAQLTPGNVGDEIAIIVNEIDGPTIGTQTYAFANPDTVLGITQAVIMGNGDGTLSSIGEFIQMRKVVIAIDGVQYLNALCDERPAEGIWNGLLSFNTGIGDHGEIFEVGSPTIHQLPYINNLIHNTRMLGMSGSVGGADFVGPTDTGLGFWPPEEAITLPGVTALDTGLHLQSVGATRGYITYDIDVSGYIGQLINLSIFIDEVTVSTGQRPAHIPNGVIIIDDIGGVALGRRSGVYEITEPALTIRVGLGTTGNATADFKLSRPQVTLGADLKAYIPTGV